MTEPAVDFYDETTLLERLSGGLKGATRQVTFVVGSALTAPTATGEPGVPNVEGIIGLIEDQFDEKQRTALRARLNGAQNRYQEAFRFLLGGRGPQVANGIIKQAVALARTPQSKDALRDYALSEKTTDDVCRSFDDDSSSWYLTPAVEAMGRLAVGVPSVFGRMVITTNFDPLIGAAISRFGGHSFRTFLHRDGNVNQAAGNGTHIVHLHGYWYGSDTLHTPRQLVQERPQLRASLRQVFRESIVVVLGYGGWDDTFMQSLRDVVADDSFYPEIIWTFYKKEPLEYAKLIETLGPGIDRGRVALYSGIDCHSFLPKLASAWEVETVAQRVVAPIPMNHSYRTHEEPSTVRITPNAIRQIARRTSKSDADSPPQIDFIVGRDEDLADITTSTDRAVFITGLGGQGKSALAATFFESAFAHATFDHRIWRDCREQSGRFEDQILTVIEAVNDGRVSSAELSRQSIPDLAELFASLTQDLKLLIVFDNVDHYVDLERNILSGTMGEFLIRFLQLSSSARLVFTCRPPIADPNPAVLTKRLQGIGLGATRDLFRLRKAPATEDAVKRAHDVTGGHPFWLDLLAAQVAKRSPQVQLDDLLKSISAGSGEIPDATLRSIWTSLRDREQFVLQSLAETLRPPTALQLSDYLRGHINYNQFSRALRLLRDLNLVVVKITDENEESFELHPVIRAFITKTLPRSVRKPFVEAILAALAPFFGAHRAELSKKPSPRTISHWIEGAELSINSDRFEEALDRLEDVRAAVRKNQPPGEFVRVGQLLLERADLTNLMKADNFDEVFGTLVKLLANLGRTEEASDALARYRETLGAKDARYINYCELQSYLHWMNGNYPAAIRWGSDGVELKTKSGVDTLFSSAHVLALAQRDSGAIDPALEHFLEDASLEEVIDPAVFEEDRGGAFYGNIGRCLHMMGQIDTALICYRKSARAVEQENDTDHLENQAYIRQWIGELLLLRHEKDAAKIFLKSSHAKWSIVSPPKAAKVARSFEKAFPHDDLDQLSEAACEQFALSWIRTN